MRSLDDLLKADHWMSAEQPNALVGNRLTAPCPTVHPWRTRKQFLS